MRKTKIVMTMGPALMQEDRLRAALREADAVRLNASHGDPEARLRTLNMVRAMATELGRSIPVFLDLQGPKWRIGALESPVTLTERSVGACLLYTSPSPRDRQKSRMPSSA